VITPKEAQRLALNSKTAEQLEARVDKALAASAESNRWPCTVALTGEFNAFAQEITHRYHAVGWKICVRTDDQRDGPFLMINPPWL
jgi:hypothetical protein